MDINQKSAEGLKRFFEANISSKDIALKESEELKNIAKNVNLKGFRKGKAPLDIIKKNYEQSILVRVFENLTKDILLEIYKKYKITPVTEPKVDITKGDLMKKEDLTISLEFEIYPEIPEFNLTKLCLDKVNLQVTDKDVDSFLNNLQQHYFDFKDIEEDRPLKMGDVANIDFVGKMDNVEFEGGAAKGVDLEIGSKSFIEGFEEQLVGLNKNDEKDITVTFPSNYTPKPEYSGKEAVFSIKVNNIKEKVNTSLEKLPKKLGIQDLDTLKEDIKKRHEHQYNMMLKKDLKNQLVENIVKDFPDFELPKLLIERESNLLKKDYEKYKELRASGNKEPNKDYDNKSEEEIIKGQEEAAIRRIKLSLIFNNISEVNNIYILPDEVDDFIKQEASKFGNKAKEVTNSYKNNPTIINNIKSIILEDKIISFILSKAKYNEQTMSVEEYNKFIEEKFSSDKK